MHWVRPQNYTPYANSDHRGGASTFSDGVRGYGLYLGVLRICLAYLGVTPGGLEELCVVLEI